MKRLPAGRQVVTFLEFTPNPVLNLFQDLYLIGAKKRTKSC